MTATAQIKFIWYIWSLICLGLVLFIATPTALAQDEYLEDNSAIILMYHRFGEDKYPSTNIKIEQFEAHIKALKSGGFTFLKLSELIDHLTSGTQIKDKSIVITVDDAYKSAMVEAWPRLKAAGIPLTVFVATDAVDRDTSNYMNWDDIRQLVAEGVDIGHHSASHLHMPHMGVEVTMADIAKASSRFQAELGFVPKILAYPYGEYNKAIRSAVESAGFTAAVSQYSSPVTQSQDIFGLPRFSMNERFGKAGRFKLVTNARALPVSEVTPSTPELTEATNPPLMGFTVSPSVRSTRSLACYPSHMGEPATLLRPTDRRIEVRFDKPLPKGRSRINCTMAGPDNRWYWLGRLFWVPGGVLD